MQVTGKNIVKRTVGKGTFFFQDGYFRGSFLWKFSQACVTIEVTIEGFETNIGKIVEIFVKKRRLTMTFQLFQEKTLHLEGKLARSSKMIF